MLCAPLGETGASEAAWSAATVRVLQGGSQDVRDAAELPGDGESQSAERGDDADGDHSQDDAVLGHRLTLLALGSGAEQIDPGLEVHVVTPPFATRCEQGRWRKCGSCGDVQTRPPEVSCALSVQIARKGYGCP